MQYNPNYLNNQNYTNYPLAKNIHLPNNIESNGLYQNYNYQQDYLMKNNYFGGDPLAEALAAAQTAYNVASTTYEKSNKDAAAIQNFNNATQVYNSIMRNALTSAPKPAVATKPAVPTTTPSAATKPTVPTTKPAVHTTTPFAAPIAAAKPAATTKPTVATTKPATTTPSAAPVAAKPAATTTPSAAPVAAKPPATTTSPATTAEKTANDKAVEELYNCFIATIGTTYSVDKSFINYMVEINQGIYTNIILDKFVQNLPSLPLSDEAKIKLNKIINYFEKLYYGGVLSKEPLITVREYISVTIRSQFKPLETQSQQGGNIDIYFKKYLKYKTLYLRLKNL